MRIYLIILLVFIGFNSSAQLFYNRTNGLTTPNDPFLSASKALYIPRLADTSLMGGLDTLGAIIYVKTTASFYIRDTILTGVGHRWTKILKAGDIPTPATIYTKDSSISVTRTINFLNTGALNLSNLLSTTISGARFGIQGATNHLLLLHTEINGHQQSLTLGNIAHEGTIWTSGGASGGNIVLDTMSKMLIPNLLGSGGVDAQDSLLTRNFGTGQVRYMNFSRFALRQALIDTAAAIRSALTSTTASNGVTKSGNDIQLGDSLTHPTTIDTRAHSLTLSGTKASGGLLTINNAGTGKGIVANSTSDNAIEGIAANGTGVTGSSTGGVGVFGQSENNVAGVFYVLPGTGNTETTALQLTSAPTVSATDGTAVRADWYNKNASGSVVRSHRLVSILSDATGGLETSQFVFRGLNSGTEDDLFTINGNGYVTLNRYPFLTPSSDFTANRPIGYNLSTGDIVPMNSWDSGGSSGISGLTLGRVVIPASATTVTDDAGLLYDTTVNELTTDSTSVIQHRADYVTLNAVQVVDTVRTFGNSITVGSNASPTLDSGYVYRLGVSLEKPVGNYAISGRGSVTAISQHYLYTPLLHNDMSLVMVGFNDIRRNDVLGANGYKTLNKIVNAHKSIFFNHFLKSFVSSGSGSVTRYGSWATPWDARNEGGKSGTAAYSGTQNDSITYAFTDSTVGIGLIGSDAEGSAYAVYIDNVLTLTGTTVGQYDGVNDGFPGNTRAPLCVLITGMTYVAHTVKIVKTGASSILIVDYFGHLRDAATAPPLVILHAPYMNAAGYATAPNGSSVIKTDTMNNKLDSLVASFPSAYQQNVFLIETNNCYDTLTGLDLGDNIHPNNIGHRQILNCITASVGADIQPEGSIYFANDAFYGINSTGPKKFFIGAGTVNYIPKFTSSNVLGNSLIQDDGTNIGIAQTPGTYKLSVTGSLRNTTDAYLATSSGNVGIGITSASYKLDVNGQVRAVGVYNSTGSASGYNVNSRADNTLRWQMLSQAGEWTMYDINSTADRLTLRPGNGRLGIGTSNPLQKLHINGYIQLDSVDTGSPNDSLLTINEGKIDKISSSLFVTLSQLNDSLNNNTIIFDNPNLGDTLIVPVNDSTIRIKSLIVNNGLTAIVNDSTITHQMGGDFLGSTTIGNIAQNLGLTIDRLGTSNASTLTVNSNTGIGVNATSTSGVALLATTNTGSYVAGFTLNPATTNSIDEVLRVARTSSGTPANGLGGYIGFTGEVSDNSQQDMGRLSFAWTDVTLGTRTSNFTVNTTNSGSSSARFTVKGSGQLQGNGYGSGTFTGTPLYSAQFDASGNVIEGPRLAAGTFSPALTNTANISSSATFQGQYLRVGNSVTFSGQYTIDPSITATLTQLTFTLPVSSTLGAAENLSGTASDGTLSAKIYSNGAGSGILEFNSVGVAATTWTFSITYLIN